MSVVEVILLLIFAWSAWRHKWLADDGYVYLTYIQNLTENGWGPVFNRGEYVEGFTSPAWYVMLSILNWMRPGRLLDLRQMVLLVSLILSIAATAAWIRVETVASHLQNAANDQAGAPDPARDGVRRSMLTHARLNIPLVLIAAWYPLHSFATSGLETPLVSVAMLVVICYLWSGADCVWAVGIIAGILPLVRPELGVVSLMLLARHWMVNRRLKSVLLSLVIFASPLLFLLTIRVLIYGQLLPNTYYARAHTEFGVRSGIKYVFDTTLPYGLQWVLAAAVLAVVIPRFGSPIKKLEPATSRRAWFLCTAAAMALYVIAIGGDFMHARFLLPSALLVFAVFAGLGTDAISLLGRSAPNWRLQTVAGIVSVVFFFAMSPMMPTQRLLKIESNISDEELGYEQRNRDLHQWSPKEMDPWAADGVALRHLSGLLGKDIGYAARSIGQLSYFGQEDHGNVYVYDILALTRPDVARLDMSGDDQWRRVGHAKIAPDVLIAATPRIDLVSAEGGGKKRNILYFEEWKKVATIEFESRPFVLKNLDLVDLLVERAVMTPDQAQRLRDWIFTKLSSQRVDRNFVTFLTLTYHREDKISARVHALAELDRSSAWRSWLNATQNERQLLDASGCSALGVRECLGRAIDRQTAEPIPALPNSPDWADVTPPVPD